MHMIHTSRSIENKVYSITYYVLNGERVMSDCDVRIKRHATVNRHGASFYRRVPRGGKRWMQIQKMLNA